MAASRPRGGDGAAPLTVHANRVSVTGRVTSVAVSRTMPSGDELVTWRVVVDRPARRARGPAFDVVDCVAWTARVRRAALGWAAGDVVSLDGALRRRFWRSPGGGLQSRCEIEVRTATRVAAPLNRRRKLA